MFWFFSQEACGILVPQPGLEPTAPALEGKVFTGPPGKSLIKNPLSFHSLSALLWLLWWLSGKESPGNAGDRGDSGDSVPSLDWENPLEEGMATHSSILAWEIPWTETLAGYSPRRSKELDTTESAELL